MGFLANYMRNLMSLAIGREPVEALLFSYYVTHRCTLRCEYCSDGGGRAFHQDVAAELSTDDARRLIGILAAASDTLDITGGEPLMRDDLEELLVTARGLGMRTVLNTNGMSLPDRPEIMDNCDVLVISLDSTCPDALGRITGQDAAGAQRILDAVQYAIDRRKQTATSVVLSAVAVPGRLSQAGKVLELAVVNDIGFQLSPQISGTEIHPDLPGAPAYLRLLDTAIARKRSGARVLGIERYLRGIRDLSDYRCHPLLMPTIRPDGAMYYPCLESAAAPIDLLEAGDYRAAVRSLRRKQALPTCKRRCHIFCHMALSLLQRSPVAALGELKYMRS
ncbi:MAG: radical SAM protein [Phycisphaerae bacterium]|jgi:MoaA/NifB/PqqE/SkfB family radical SAM enzyme|nr:radical SAM protein [Phycisphaerae bacterium]